MQVPSARIDHPVAADARRLLQEEGGSLSPALALALAAVARHAADGEVLAERVFAARHLGQSKALAGLRAALEQRLGPLAALGVREGAALTLVGGCGRLVLDGGATLDLGYLSPFVGLSREAAGRIVSVQLPSQGLVAVENLTVFDACCRGEVGALGGAAFVWTAGYPGRGTRAIVEAAVSARAKTMVWCDLDLDGVRIARLVRIWAPGTRAYQMTRHELLNARHWLPLTPRARQRLERELAVGTDDDLTDALRAMLELGRWVEQESMLGPVSPGP